MINQFGAAGSGNVEFNNPSQIRVLPNGNLWVWDMGNSRWQEITPSGSFVSESSSGVPPGFDLSGLPENEWTKRLGPSGNEWITTSADRLVYTEWRGTRAFIQGQALDSIGTDFTDTFFRTAYLSRGSVASIRTVDAAGSFINTIGGSALRLLTYNTPSAIDPTPTEFTGIWHWGALRFDVLPNGGLVTVCGTFRPDQAGQSYPDTDVVVRCYAPDGTLAWELEIPDSGDVSIGNVASSAQRGIQVFEGRIWVFVSGVNPRTVVMDTNGSLVGTGPVFPANASTGHYDFPTATYNGALVSPDGRAFIPVLDAVGVPTGWTRVRDEVAGGWEPRLGRIAVDSLGRTYRIDPRGTEYGANMLVQRSEWDGTSLTNLGVAGKGRGQFLIPLGVAVGPDDTVYVSDSANHRVQLFTRDRSYIGAFPVPYPGQIEVRGNRIYVLEAASRIGVYIMDPNPPTSTFTKSPEANAAGWNTSAVTGTIMADDGSNGVGVKEIHYSVDMGTEQTVAGSSATLSIADPGIHTVAFWSVDNNGNIETTRYATVKIDSTKPTTAGSFSPVANASGWNRTAVLFTATGTDNASGVATVALRVNGGAELSTAGTSATTTLSTEGIHTVEHRASDLAGNPGDWVSNTVRIDTTAPSVTVSVVGQTLALTATDALSGVATIHYAIDGGAPKVYTGPVAIALTAKTVSTWAVDVAGNTSATSTKPLRNFLKSISISPGPTAYAGSTVSVRVDLVASPPSGGLVVALASSVPSVLPVPVSVTVPEGALSASFTVDLRGVSTDRDVRLTATLDGAFANANLVVLVPVPKTLSVTPSAIIG
ncbi:MAG: OmpL47-type beta-barrel domain-containing protein, partial [Armatimonadaceae bacterium]